MDDSDVRNLWKTFDEQFSAMPGGTSLHPAVLRNMQRPYVNPWSSEFLAYFDETLELLKRLYNTRHDVLIMIGPIRLAMGRLAASWLMLIHCSISGKRCGSQNSWTEPTTAIGRRAGHCGSKTDCTRGFVTYWEVTGRRRLAARCRRSFIKSSPDVRRACWVRDPA